MLVELTRSVDLPVDPASSWAILRDVQRLATCVPGASEVVEIEPDRRYAGIVADRVGPFKVRMGLEVLVEQMDEPTFLKARLAGNDKTSQTRVDGHLEARLSRIDDQSTRLELSGKVEIRGPLTSMGAPIVRRRAAKIFDEFAACLHSALAKPGG